MPYSNSSYHKKWWIKTIRERNFFGFRYWWFNWSIWIICLFVLCFELFNSLKQENDQCLNRNNLSRRVVAIDDALQTCCTCNTPPPVIPPDTTDTISPTPPPPNIPPPVKPPPPPPPPNATNCNQQTKSGGEGVDNNIVVLGTQSGMVSLAYNMESVPDKLEVFYEGNLIASTFSVSGNDNGFVGGSNQAGASGYINFLYQYHSDQFVTVRVTGPQGTSWTYVVSCPV